MSEPYFVSHCDDGSCDMGYFEYTCPACKKRREEFGEVWWAHQAGKDFDGASMRCDGCGADLVVRNKNYDMSVELHPDTEGALLGGQRASQAV